MGLLRTFINAVVPLIFLSTVHAAHENALAPLQETLHKRAGTNGIGIVVGFLSATETNIVSSSTNFTGESIFEIASITKTFTATLLAEMSERGEVKLDDPAQKFLPAPVKMPERGGRQITLRHLATHTSGLPRMPGNFNPRSRFDPYADYTLKKLHEFISGYSLPRDIGKKYEYSNLGVALIGQILASVANTNYENLVINRVCLPLEMTHTSITLSPSQKTHLAPGHNQEGAPAPNWNLAVMSGAGGLRSSVSDMLKYLSANLGLTKTPLAGAMEKAQSTRTKTDKPGLEMGLAWHISHRFGRELIWHNGQTGGYHSFIGFDKEARKGVIILSNCARNIDDIGFGLLGKDFPSKSPRVETKP